MSPADIVIIAVAVLIVGGGIFYNMRKRIKNKKNGTSGCSGCCGCSSRDESSSGCSSSGCGSSEKK